MSRSRTAEFARHSASWLLLILCIALLAWRIDYRVEQCEAASPTSPAVVAYFDANERNAASLDEMHLDPHTRFGPDYSHLRLDLDSVTAVIFQARETASRPPEIPPVLPGLFVRSTSNLPNPPPTLA